MMDTSVSDILPSKVIKQIHISKDIHKKRLFV